MRVQPTILISVAAAGAMACSGGTEPTEDGPPYLAIIPKVSGLAPGDTLPRARYLVQDLSTGGMLDTVIVAAPADTVILPVRPATYGVTLLNLSPTCVSRYGVEAEAVVPEGVNTAVVRYYITCNVPLTVTVSAVGLTPPDSSFIWELSGGSVLRTGIAPLRGTVLFEDLAPGTYRFSLYNVPETCAFLSSGGRTQTVTVPPSGQAQLKFGISCARESARPEIRSLFAGYHDGVGVFILHARDPDRDIRGYFWDLTDCNGRSLLPGGARERGGLGSGRTANWDTLTVIGAFELGLPDSGFAGQCAMVRVIDAGGNASRALEVPLRDAVTSRPRARSFNARFQGQERLSVDLEVEDPDGDFAGVFGAARLRDGVVSMPDGQPDIGIYHPAGYLGQTLPDLLLGSRILFSDVYASIVYLVDQKGNFTRLVDEDLFR